MEKALRILGWVIAVVLAFILMYRGCGESPTYLNQSDTLIIHDTIPGDSVPYLVETKVPEVIWKQEIIEIPQDVDTAEILKAYFQKVFYDDTIYSDTNQVIVIIKDTVETNRITGRKVYVQNLREKVISTTTIVNQYGYRKLLIGGGIGSISGQISIGLGIMYQTKKDNLLGVTYFPTHGFMLNYYHKLKWNRPRKLNADN